MKQGAENILIGHCSDCTNTVVENTSKINMKIHHATDHILDALNMDRIRKLK
ncbi:MAG: hypothetical protein Q4B52_06705 [Tissierellia bacterium]|nr:hypothetical protein [Tissierellia bacterium]